MSKPARSAARRNIRLKLNCMSLQPIVTLRDPSLHAYLIPARGSKEPEQLPERQPALPTKLRADRVGMRTRGSFESPFDQHSVNVLSTPRGQAPMIESGPVHARPAVEASDMPLWDDCVPVWTAGTQRRNS